jgi:hypothetical protein
VVEILRAQGERRDRRGVQGVLVGEDQDGVAGVGERRVAGLAQADPVSDLAEPERPGVGGEPAPRKSAARALAPRVAKWRGSR